MPGGRPRGSKNKKDYGRLAAVREILGEDFCPIIEQAKIALHPNTKPDLKVQAFNNITPYFYPKLKVVEVQAEVDHVIEVRWIGESPDSLPAKTTPGDDT